jgi:hypothetical protein
VLSTTAKFQLQYLEYESLSMNQHTFEYRSERMQCREAMAMQISPAFKSYGVRARIAWPSLLDTASSVSYYKLIHMHRADCHFFAIIRQSTIRSSIQPLLHFDSSRRLHVLMSSGSSPNRILFVEEPMQIPTSGGDVLSSWMLPIPVLRSRTCPPPAFIDLLPSIPSFRRSACFH